MNHLVEGTFSLTHQAIAITVSGKTGDGQHRLGAIVESGISATLPIAYNVPDESVLAFDAGLPRSIRDAMKMAGKGEYSTAIIACARMLPVAPTFNTHKLSYQGRDTVVELLRVHASALEYAEKIIPRARGLTAAVRCLAARASYSVTGNERKKLDAFFSIVSQGFREDGLQSSEDVTAHHYRNYLIHRIGQNGMGSDAERYQKGQFALQAYLAGRSITKLFANKGDLFPLPDG